MRIFDTKTKCYVPFGDKPVVDIYVCGITPYDAAHLGHIFTFMTYDLLQRYLEDAGHKVRLVRNITDVDEPIYTRAKEEGITYTELAEREVASFHEVMKQLHFRPPFAEPKASEYIEKMALAVKDLLDNGYAYRLDNDIYFDVSKFPDFGSFSGFSKKLKLGFMRERGGDPDRAGKRQPLDFLLWKGIDDPNDPAKWTTDLGQGRPGWHIECTIMSQSLLGTPFDLHGGGADLIFPHHECENAQSYSLHGKPPAEHWMHVSPLFHDGEKMSKSLGNLVFAKDLLKDNSPEVVRLALMTYHHRIGGEWQSELLEEAKELWNAFKQSSVKATKAQAQSLLREVCGSLADDLNTLNVIEALHRFTSSTTDTSSEGQAQDLINRTLKLIGLS